jgi:hypothetical protein
MVKNLAKAPHRREKERRPCTVAKAAQCAEPVTPQRNRHCAGGKRETEMNDPRANAGTLPEHGPDDTGIQLDDTGIARVQYSRESDCIARARYDCRDIINAADG